MVFAPTRRALATGIALTLILAACGSSSADTTAGSASPTTAQATTSTSQPPPTTAPTTTTATTVGLPGACPDDLPTSQGVVIGVQDWVRVRLLPTTASEEIGRFDAGSAVTIFPDTLGYDGSDHWWVTTQVPATGGCGSVAANFLTDPSGRLDQQIPGLSFRAPTSTGTWTYADRTSLRDRIEGSLDGAFFTTYWVTVTDGLLIDQLLADQLSEFEELEYDYPADWTSDVLIPGADRAVRLIPIASPSGDLVIDRLLIEIGPVTVEAATEVYVEDFERAPLEDLAAFVDSVAFDRETFLSAVAR
jgi:hypothetical protein